MNASSNDEHNEGNNDNNNNNNDSNKLPEDQRQKGKGRRKIQMEKIENESNLQVTFSKRRAGVFKKASELSTLCGAESLLVVFSPGGKPHSFGHPNVDTVSNRFLNPNGTQQARPNATEQLIAAHNAAAMQQHNQELVSQEAALKLEKRRKKEMKQLSQVEELDDLDQLAQMRQALTGLQNVYTDISIEAQNAIFNANNYVGGGSATAMNHVNQDVAAAGSSAWNIEEAASSSLWDQFVNVAVDESSNWDNITFAETQPQPQPQGPRFPNSVYDYGGSSTSQPAYPPYEFGQGSSEPAADPNALPPPPDPQDPNASQVRRNHRRRPS